MADHTSGTGFDACYYQESTRINNKFVDNMDNIIELHCSQL